MKRVMLALVILLLVITQVMSSCGKATVTTETEFKTITGSVSTTTVNVTGAATTIIMATTIPGPTVTTTQVNTTFFTATVTGPTTTLTTTKTGLVTQGFTYVSAITPASPATLHLNDWVTVTLDYAITDPGGARMFAIPMTNGVPTPNCSTGSQGPVTAGKGTTTGLGFSVASGSGKITEIRLLMKNPSQTITFFDVSIPVDFTFGP